MAWESGIAAGLTVLGGATRIKGQQQQGSAEQQAAYYQARVAQNNADIANRMATRAVEGGEARADIGALHGAAGIAAAKAREAALGTRVNQGSNVDVRAGMAQGNAYDYLATLRNAQLEGWGYRSRAAGFQAESALDIARGNYAPQAANIRSAGTLLETASALPFGWIGSQIGSLTGGDATSSNPNLSNFPVGGGPQGPSGGF